MRKLVLETEPGRYVYTFKGNGCFEATPNLNNAMHFNTIEDIITFIRGQTRVTNPRPFTPRWIRRTQWVLVDEENC